MSRFVFRHEAMATWFEIAVGAPGESLARQAAQAAFRELDRLEAELSRFVESSDIARANRLRNGESIVIGDDALECLALAAEIAEATGRAFDPAYASIADSTTLESAPFQLDPVAHTLVACSPRLHLDLGAIGKGYALDRMAEVLLEWEIHSASLNSGGSTVRLLDAPAGELGWPVRIGEDPAWIEMRLSHCALSGSSPAIKGNHLIDPRTGAAAKHHRHAWVRADNAAVADALSTALFVMSPVEAEAFCQRHPEIGAAWLDPCGRLTRLGAWPVGAVRAD